MEPQENSINYAEDFFQTGESYVVTGQVTSYSVPMDAPLNFEADDDANEGLIPLGDIFLVLEKKILKSSISVDMKVLLNSKIRYVTVHCSDERDVLPRFQKVMI